MNAKHQHNFPKSPSSQSERAFSLLLAVLFVLVFLPAARAEFRGACWRLTYHPGEPASPGDTLFRLEASTSPAFSIPATIALGSDLVVADSGAAVNERTFYRAEALRIIAHGLVGLPLPEDLDGDGSIYDEPVPDGIFFPMPEGVWYDTLRSAFSRPVSGFWLDWSCGASDTIRERRFAGGYHAGTALVVVLPRAPWRIGWALRMSTIGAPEWERVEAICTLDVVPDGKLDLSDIARLGDRLSDPAVLAGFLNVRGRPTRLKIEASW